MLYPIYIMMLVLLSVEFYLLWDFLYSDKSIRSISLVKIPFALLAFLIYEICLDFYRTSENSYISDVWCLVPLLPIIIYIVIGIFVRLNRYWIKR
jgi:hypothetical protein